MTFRNIQLDRFAVRWTGALSVVSMTFAIAAHLIDVRLQNRQNEAPSFMLARVVTILISSLVLSVVGLITHAVLFGLSRAIVLPVVFRLPVISRLLRPFMAHFLRGSWSLTLLTRNIPLMFRAWAVGFMTILNWDFAESIFDSIVAEVSNSMSAMRASDMLYLQPVSVAQTTADPMLTVVSGVRSSDVYFKHFAYAELQQLASDESPAASSRRTALFADQKYNPTMWTTLVRESLLTLGKDYQLFLRRGAPPAPSTHHKISVLQLY